MTAIEAAMLYPDSARIRSSPWNSSWMIPRTWALMVPAPKPCSARPATLIHTCGALADRIPPSRNTTRPTTRGTLRPYRSPSRPAGTSPRPKVSEYDARNHWICWMEASSASVALGTA